MPRRVAVVANGAAGALLADQQAEGRLAGQFAAAGIEPLFVPQTAGTLRERLEQACGMGADAVVVAGGDGSIACAAEYLAGTALPLGILPFGTMNLLAKDLGIPVGDTQAAIDVLSHGAVRGIDVGTVNGHVFLCASMLGLPAGLARHRERGRHRTPVLAWSRFAVAAVRALLRADLLRLALRTETGERRVAAQVVTVTVNALSGESGHAFGRGSLDGAEFAVYVIARLRLGDVLRLGWRALTSRIETDPAIAACRTRRLAVGSGRRALRVMNDGEIRLLRPPLRYRLLPGALQVLAPPTGH